MMSRSLNGRLMWEMLKWLLQQQEDGSYRLKMYNSEDYSEQ